MSDEPNELTVLPTSIEELFKQIDNRTIDPRDIGYEQRREIIDHLRTQIPRTYATQDQMADLLKVSKQLVSHDIKVIQKNHALTLMSGGPLLVIGKYLDAARVAGDLAMNSCDPALFWKINQDMFTSLQKIGLIPNAPDKDDDGPTGPTNDLRLSRTGNFNETALQLAHRIQDIAGKRGS